MKKRSAGKGGGKSKGKRVGKRRIKDLRPKGERVVKGGGVKDHSI